MAAIGRITSANPATGITTKVTTGMRKLNYFQFGQIFENGKPKYQELYIQGHNYFKHIKATYDKLGRMIKGSRFSEEITGPEANKRMIHKFGVDA